MTRASVARYVALRALVVATPLVLAGCSLEAPSSSDEGALATSEDESALGISPLTPRCAPGVCGWQYLLTGGVYYCACKADCRLSGITDSMPPDPNVTLPDADTLHFDRGWAVPGSSMTGYAQHLTGWPNGATTAGPWICQSPAGCAFPTNGWMLGEGLYSYTVGSGFTDLRFPGLVVADPDRDGRYQNILSAVFTDPADGRPRWVYRVQQGPTNRDYSREVPIPIGGEGGKVRGSGLAVGQLDFDPRPDLVLSAVVSLPGNDVWRYRVGLNVDVNGNATWLPTQEVASEGLDLRDGGVVIGDLDADGRSEIVLSSTEDAIFDYLRYRIGHDCHISSGACSWAPVGTLARRVDPMKEPDERDAFRGGNVLIADVVAPRREAPKNELIVAAVTYGRDCDSFGTDGCHQGYGTLHWVGSACNVTTGVCTWSPPVFRNPSTTFTYGGGLTIRDDGDTGIPSIKSSSGADYTITRTAMCPNRDALNDYMSH
jgi:hypothetical protein